MGEVHTQNINYTKLLVLHAQESMSSLIYTSYIKKTLSTIIYILHVQGIFSIASKSCIRKPYVHYNMYILHVEKMFIKDNDHYNALWI